MVIMRSCKRTQEYIYWLRRLWEMQDGAHGHLPTMCEIITIEDLPSMNSLANAQLVPSPLDMPVGNYQMQASCSLGMKRMFTLCLLVDPAWVNWRKAMPILPRCPHPPGRFHRFHLHLAVLHPLHSHASLCPLQLQASTFG